MKKFIYTALNSDGKKISGKIEADSTENALGILSSSGYIPVNVKDLSRNTGKNILSEITKSLTSVKLGEIIIFTKQFRTMLKAGVGIIDLLQILESQTENSKLKEIIKVIRKDIKEGATLYDAFIKHDKIFPNIYCSMIRAGETSGSLVDVLERLTYILEHEHKVKSDVKAALQYPIIVILFLGVAFLVLLTFVIPKFIHIFEKAGLVLPLPTKICIVLYHVLNAYWPFIICGVILIAGSLYYYNKTKNGQYFFDVLKMKIPIIGDLVIKSVMSRFASIFSILQASGISILDSLDILSATMGNEAISREFDKIGSLLSEGHGISAPLEVSNYFPPMVVNMVAIGEESGNMVEMLNEISIHYDSEVEYSVKQLSEAIGPVLTVCLAVIIGFFALAIFLPMWDLTKMVK